MLGHASAVQLSLTLNAHQLEALGVGLTALDVALDRASIADGYEIGGGGGGNSRGGRMSRPMWLADQKKALQKQVRSYIVCSPIVVRSALASGRTSLVGL
jgi:hypothetical protein